MDTAGRSRTLLGLAVAAVISLAACGSSTGGGTAATTGSAQTEPPTTASAPTTAVPAAVQDSPAAAKQAVCAQWSQVAPQLQTHAQAHQNADLYTDSGQSSDSSDGSPFEVAQSDAEYASDTLQNQLINVATVIKNGDGSDASFTADEQAISAMTEACA